MARAIRLWVVGVATTSVAAGSLLALYACLPALETLPPTPGDDDANVSQPAAFCGDGVIDYDAAADGAGSEQCDPGDGGATGCTKGCIVDCPGGFVDRETNHCYFTIPGGASQYQAAKDACIARGGHLVTFAGLEERAKVVDAGLYGGPLVVWVGMFQNPGAGPGRYTPSEDPGGALFEPGWSPTCPGCYAFIPDGSPPLSIPKVRPTDAGFPDAAVQLNGPYVGDSRIASTWFQLPAGLNGYSATVICEREPVGSCASPCTGGSCIAIKETFGRKRYLFVPAEQPAAAADQFRRTLSKGQGRLVVLSTHEEREQLMKEVARELAASGSTATGVWIGLSRQTDQWSWDDGAPFPSLPNPWGDGEPTTNPPVGPAGPARAFANVSNVPAADTELAHAGDPTVKRPFVCQY